MKRITSMILLLTSIVITSKVYGQQDPQYTQYMYNMHVLNPAYAGSEGTLNIGLLGRTQWVGIDGAPKTLTATLNAPIGKRVGLGFSVIADEIGPTKEQNVYADFSYTLPVSEEGNLAFGLKGGFTFLNAHLSTLRTVESGDPAFRDNINKTMPNFGAGLFYYTDSYYLGLSVPNILKATHINKDYSAVEEVHGFLTAGYIFDISEDIKLKPSGLIKAATGAPLSIDLSLNALLKQFLELGISWRHDDSVSGLVNVKVSRNIRIGYAYDYTLSELSNYNSGTHELMMLINITNSRDVMVSPRFF